MPAQRMRQHERSAKMNPGEHGGQVFGRKRGAEQPLEDHDNADCEQRNLQECARVAPAGADGPRTGTVKQIEGLRFKEFLLVGEFVLFRGLAECAADGLVNAIRLPSHSICRSILRPSAGVDVEQHHPVAAHGEVEWGLVVAGRSLIGVS